MRLFSARTKCTGLSALVFGGVVALASGAAGVVARGMAVTLAGLGVKDEGNNETVETKDLSENENQNHADEKLGLLSGTTDTRVTNNTNGETSGKTGDTDGETGTKVDEAVEQRVVSANVVGNEDGHDETVNGNDTSHDDGNDALHDKLGAHDGHGSDTGARLGGTVSSTKSAEDHGGGGTHDAEERRVDGAHQTLRGRVEDVHGRGIAIGSRHGAGLCV